MAATSSGRSSAGRSFARRRNQRQPPANAVSGISTSGGFAGPRSEITRGGGTGSFIARFLSGSRPAEKQFRLDRHPGNRLPRFRHRRRCRCHRRGGGTWHWPAFDLGVTDAKIAIAQHGEMHLPGDRRRALVERGEGLGGQILLRATHCFGRHLKAERGGRQAVGLQCPGEFQNRVRIFTRQYDRLAAAPARGAVRRPLLADIVEAGFDLNVLCLPCAIEGGCHAAVDRRLHGPRIRPGFLGPEFDAQHIARDLALGGLAEMQHSCALIRILCQHRSGLPRAQPSRISAKTVLLTRFPYTAVSSRAVWFSKFLSRPNSSSGEIRAWPASRQVRNLSNNSAAPNGRSACPRARRTCSLSMRSPLVSSMVTWS